MQPRAVATLLAISVLAAPAVGANEPEPLGRRVRAHVEFLADDLLRGRETGTESYEIAARYVATQLALLGLEPAAPGGGWFQEVPLLSSRLVEGSAAVIVHGERGDDELVWLDDYAMGADAAREATEVTAPVVFAGWGVSAPELGHDDYAEVDVEGRIVLMLSGAPVGFPNDQRAYYSSGRVKRQEAARRGAVGLLSVPTLVDARRVPWERRIRNPYRRSMKWVDAEGKVGGFEPQIAGSAVLSHVGAAKLLAGSPRGLEAILEEAGRGEARSFELPVTVTLRRRAELAPASGSNVVGRLAGSDPELAAEAVVYTAHLDHVGVGEPRDGDEIYNGAYDNAAGVAVMLETARLFVEGGRSPRRSVLFVAVTGEEKGLLGSEYFVLHSSVPVERMVANVNLDMPLFLAPVSDVVAFGAEHSSLEGIVELAASEAGLAVSPDPFPEEVIFVRSDQFSFVRHGVPAIFLVPGFGSRDGGTDGESAIRDFLAEDYHTPGDDLSLPFDLGSAARFTRANHAVGREAAGRDDRPVWNPGDFFGERFGREIR